MSTLGGAGEDGTDGPPGIFILDCRTFHIIGRYEIERGVRDMHYDFWWNLPRDHMASSEWGLPPQYENGVVPEDLLGNSGGLGPGKDQDARILWQARRWENSTEIPGPVDGPGGTAGLNHTVSISYPVSDPGAAAGSEENLHRVLLCPALHGAG